MKKYFSLFRIRLVNSIQYRAVTLGAVVSNLAWVLLEIMMYIAISKVAGNNMPMTFPEIVTYVWMKRIIMGMVTVVAYDGEIYGVIHDGTIAYELVRPMDLYGKWFFQAMANRVSSTAVSFIPMILLAFILPDPYGMALPKSVSQFVVFLISVVLALCIVLAFAMLMFITLFYTIAYRGIKIIVTTITSFLSGGMIPLTFFPVEITKVLVFLPFSAMQSTPLLIYSGNLSGTAMTNAILIQVFWMITLVLFGKVLMQKSLKKIVVQGG